MTIKTDLDLTPEEFQALPLKTKLLSLIAEYNDKIKNLETLTKLNSPSVHYLCINIDKTGEITYAVDGDIITLAAAVLQAMEKNIDIRSVFLAGVNCFIQDNGGGTLIKVKTGGQP